ncbi:ABC-2 type transport system ATP-binding protein [Catenuloplanes nepalensis]|uniref:ABC-2 type transport system ATP-binding protein n=1 Tax=Catenuloplanes nepalensis TaxID=587533 RepID=A0ABT9MVE6_9ACTN|nr:ATP-binding cassette domain-containing protein [Catenuloplanes nepalensis]MDP9795407.1 ABC-2 type transport system ATP-binding protein [Catenuloplanes nepalensis]
MIKAKDLTKDFGAVHAVRGITLDIAPGELVAVLGPNGAGKTTTMRMLTTLIAPTSGSAEVAGHDVVRSPGEVRRRIGYVGQGNGAGHQHRVIDELHSQAAIYGLERGAARTRVGSLVEALDLGDLVKRKVSELSGGQRRRLDVAMGLVHTPKLLFLDEPSTGLDPQNRANLWEHILRLRAEHDMTIVLTTHYLDEADSMAERVVIVDHGEVIADDTAAALKRRLAGDRVSFTCASPADLAVLVPGATDLSVTGNTVAARVTDGPAAIAETLRAAFEKGLTITAAETFRPTLDDVFLSLTGRSLREENTK